MWITLEKQYIVARCPGSMHDSRTFDNSRFCAEFEDDRVNGILLGEAGYACRLYLMTPVVISQTPSQRRYDAVQIRTRGADVLLFKHRDPNKAGHNTRHHCSNFIRTRRDPLDYEVEDED